MKWFNRRLAVLLAGAVTGIAVMLLFSCGEKKILPALAVHKDQEQILVLDAGHGGIDGGAVAQDGTVEQDINLAIVKKCRDLAALFGCTTVLTRTDEHSLDYDAEKSIRANKVADIHAREQMVTALANPVFVSVHLNKFSDSSYSGAQTFWSKNNPSGETLAESMQSALTAGLLPPKQREPKQADSSIYLMKHLTCPAVIVECGFLSNAEETQKLKDAAYQTKLAVCIVSGYMNYCSEENKNED